MWAVIRFIPGIISVVSLITTILLPTVLTVRCKYKGIRKLFLTCLQCLCVD